MATARVHLIIHGRVQGVAFRYSAEDQANRIGIGGWVRNLHNGTVEIIAEGQRSELEELIKWCGHGPSLARVTDVEIEWLEPTNEFERFYSARTQ